jgi:hypothetical protein
MAVRTADTLLVVRRALVRLRDGVTTGIALIVAAAPKLLVDGNTLVKDKALALPGALACGNVLEIL